MSERALPAQASTEHVLIVEDDPMLAGLLATALEGQGAEITTATSLQTGLDRLDSGKPVTRLVTDFLLSGTVDCKPLLAKAYASQPPIPCVIMSGNIVGIDMAQLLSGISAHSPPALLQKPFGIGQFIETVFAMPRSAGVR